jgi:hypothetical protein
MQRSSRIGRWKSPIPLVLALGATVFGALLALAPSGCSDEPCQVELADSVREPHKAVRQFCLQLRADGCNLDTNRRATCAGTKLSCPEGFVLGSDCPGDPFKEPVPPDAGTD